MIFVYNDTSLKLNLHSVKTKGTQGTSAVELQIADSDSGMAKTITKVTDPELCEEVQNKFGNTSGRSIKYNPSKEFVMLKDKCILFNPETDSMVVSSLAENRPKDRVKNIIVLVIDRDSRFFFPITAQWKKPNIIPFGKKHTVVVMYIKSFNWSTLNRPLNILLQHGDGKNHKSIGLQYKTVKTDKAQYTNNELVVKDYDGQFPQININYNKAKDSSDNKTSRENTIRSKEYQKKDYVPRKDTSRNNNRGKSDYKKSGKQNFGNKSRERNNGKHFSNKNTKKRY